MLPFIRVSRIAYRICVVSAGLLSFTGLVTQAHPQTAPQLLPYTAKLLAGGGTAVAANAACSRAGAVPSGHFAYDAADDGCLATEIVLSAPRSAILDSGGAVIFADNKNYTIRRIDPVTGIVATIAGGAAAAPKRRVRPAVRELWGGRGRLCRLDPDGEHRGRPARPDQP